MPDGQILDRPALGEVPAILRQPAAVIAFIEELFGRFDAAFARAPLRLTKRMADCRFEIATTCENHARQIAERLIDQADARPAATSTRLLVACCADLGLPGSPLLYGSLQDARTLEAALVATRWRLHYHHETSFWQVWDSERRIGLQLMAAPDMTPPWEGGSPLRNLLKWALSNQMSGSQPAQGLLHAGTLALDGQGILFVGRGGSGKSGTVLAGLSRGLASVGDDYVLARIGTDGIEALPLFHTLKCDPAGIARLGLGDNPALAARGQNWQGKHEFTFTELTGAPPAPALRMTALCLPVIAGADRSRFEAISQRDAFLALAPTGVAQLPGDRDEHFRLCGTVARRLPCLKLHLGRDPAEIAGTIRAALAKGFAPC